MVPTGHPPQTAHSGQQITGAAASHSITQATTTQLPSSNPPLTHLVNSNTNDTASLSMTSSPSYTTQNSMCLLKTAVATVTHGSRSATANLLFDEGSQRSFITQDLANSLVLQPYQCEDINISSFGANCHLNRQIDVAMINLLTNDGQAVPLSVLVVPRIATPLQNTASISVTQLPHLQNLQLTHPLAAEQEFEISLLVGADHYWDIVGDHIVRGVAGGPTAVASKLGYLLSGPVQPTATQSTTANVLMVTTSQSEFDLERFWNLESVGVSPTDDNAEDDMLEQYLTSSVTRDDDGAYVARFPWKPDHPTLPTNLAVTEQRTRQLVKRLVKTPQLLQLYNQIITEQQARGFIERVEPSNDNSTVHYIPHHAVKKDSCTTPIRIVFDCSCRQAPSYPCLNDCLMVGLPPVNDLCAVLVRFRSHCLGVSTDIEKAFLHIRLHPDDKRFYSLPLAD